MNSLIWEIRRMNFRVHKKFTHSLGTFHKTQFTFSQAWRMALLFLGLYIVSKLGILQYARMVHMRTVSASYMILAFILVDVIPITIVGVLFGLGEMYRRGQRRLFNDIWLGIKKWTKRFAVDIWHHKLLIFGLVIATFIIQMVVSHFVLKFAMPGQSGTVKNNTELVRLVRQSAWMLVSIDIIAPITEELVFRFWLTNIINHLFSEALNGHLPRFTYWFSAVLSALYFASKHLQGQSMLLGTSYIVLALMLQYVARRSRSLTAPVAVHALNNIITTSLALLVI